MSCFFSSTNCLDLQFRDADGEANVASNFSAQLWFILVLLSHLQGILCPPQREGTALRESLLSSLTRLTLPSAEVQNREDGQFYGLGNGTGKICSLFLPLLEISRATMGESLNCFLPYHSSCYSGRISFLFSFFLFYNCFAVIEWGYNFPEIHIIIPLNNSCAFFAELGMN